MPAFAVPAFALTWCLACYLVGRDPSRPALWRAAGALSTFAVGVAVWTVAPHSAGAQIMLCVPALLWAGTAVSLLPDSLPERRQIDLGWLVLSALFLAMVIALPEAGRLVVLAPLIGGLVLLWRFRDQVAPPMLPVALAVIALLYSAGLIVLLLPGGVGAPALVVAAIGLNQLILGYLVVVAEALDAGERLRPDLVRAITAALAGTLLFGGPAALTMLASGGSAPVVILQFVLVGVAMTAIGLIGPIRRGLDAIAFVNDQRLRQDRAALLMLSDAMLRHRQRHRLLSTAEEDFLHFTRRALDNYGDLGRLMRSPLTDLPAVDRRMTGPAVQQPLARATQLRVVLLEGVARLRPPGPLATTDEWRYYLALHYCTVLGLKPYARRPRTDGLDREARRTLDWMRRYVPKGTLRQWQVEGATIVAGHLWDELSGVDQRWSARVPPAATRST
ncbi:hypothetical protein ACWKSP_26950 [Micromonosporaceae bacterium Da 78-11]